MSSAIRLTALLLASLGLTAPGAIVITAAAAAPVDRTSPAAEGLHRGALVLNNGNLLEGAIRQVGERYQVSVPGGQIEVRASAVRYVVADRDHAYRQLRGSLAKDDAVDHLRLAHWCIQWQMPGYAAREIIAAQEIDPRCPGIEPLKRRLHATLRASQVTHTAHTRRLPSRPVQNRRRHERKSASKRSGKTSRKHPGTPVAARPSAPPRPPTVRWPSTTTQRPGNAAAPRRLGAPAAVPLLRSSPTGGSARTQADGTGQAKAPPSGKANSPQVFRPRDVFDPEIFNRRHAAAD